MTARGQSGGARLRFGRSPIPWQEFVDAIDRMVGDAGEDVGEPSLRIDVVHLGTFMPPAELCRTGLFSPVIRCDRHVIGSA